MECVVQVVRGAHLNVENYCCHFCGNETSITLLATTKEKKHDGVSLTFLALCKDHLDKLNSIISGEFDIDELVPEKSRIKPSKKLQLRS